MTQNTDPSSLLPPPSHLIEKGSQESLIDHQYMPEAHRIYGGHMDIPLTEVEAPIIDAQTFAEHTGIDAPLVATVKVGNLTNIGIVSTEQDVFAVRLLPDRSSELGFKIAQNQEDQPEIYPLTTGNVVSLGRNPESTILTTAIDTDVSREHLALSYNHETGTVRVDDFSSNGTEVFVHYTDEEEDLDKTVPRTEVDDITVPKRALGSVGVEQHANPEFLAVKCEVGVAELGKNVEGVYRTESEDTVVRDDKNAVYGVFDGAGGHKNGKKASMIAAEVSERYVNGNTGGGNLSPQEAQYAIKTALETAEMAVRASAEGGITTGTVVKIHNHEGIDYASWGSVGDSRVYVYKAAMDSLIQLSKDEGEGNTLYNALGASARVEQVGSHMLEPGDQIMICSDGVTGDGPTREQLEHHPEYARRLQAEELQDYEITEVLRIAETAEKAARDLAEVIARKNDDRACIVVRPEIS